MRWSFVLLIDLLLADNLIYQNARLKEENRAFKEMIANQKAFGAAGGGSGQTSKAPSPAPKALVLLPPASVEPSTAAVVTAVTEADESATRLSSIPPPGTPVVGETSNYNSAFLVGTPMEI